VSVAEIERRLHAEGYFAKQAVHYWEQLKAAIHTARQAKERADPLSEDQSGRG